jgi:hypothetical protein
MPIRSRWRNGDGGKRSTGIGLGSGTSPRYRLGPTGSSRVRRQRRRGPSSDTRRPCISYLCIASRALAGDFRADKLKLVGVVQITSTIMLAPVVPALSIDPTHSLGVPPTVESQSEELMFTVVSIESLKVPPPIATQPGGQTAATVTCVPAGTGVQADEINRSETGPGGPCVSWGTGRARMPGRSFQALSPARSGRASRNLAGFEVLLQQRAVDHLRRADTVRRQLCRCGVGGASEREEQRQVRDEVAA